MEEIIKRTLWQHRAALDAGEYTAVELTRLYLAKIAQKDGVVGAFLTVDAEGALRAAALSDEYLSKGQARSPLEGIPYALKDNFCTKGLRTTCASRMLEHFVPPYDATVVVRLREAGAILLGKVNMDEFAMGSANKASALGNTRNPIDPAYVAGGSSGGSAAAVAANEAVFALGSDTGGSVRQPAAFCGIVGIKPTWGAISRYGMVALASSLDSVGVVTQTVSDCGAVLSVLCGRDEKDATTRAYPDSQSLASLSIPQQPLRVAVVRELTEGDAVSDEMKKAVARAQNLMSLHGAVFEELSLPSPDAALAAYCVLSAAEASSNMGRFDGVSYGRRAFEATDVETLYANSRAEGLGEEVKRRILFGTYMLSKEKREIYYERAERARADIRSKLYDALKSYDLILTPTTPDSAFLYGDVQTPIQRRRADLCAVYANLSGLPAVTVPLGSGKNGMPLGVQLTAGAFCEELLLRAAKCLEEDTE